MSANIDSKMEANKALLFEAVSKMKTPEPVTPKKGVNLLDVTSNSPIIDESPLGKKGWLDCTEEEKAEYNRKQKRGLPITPIEKSPGGTEYMRMRMRESVKNKNIALSAKKRIINHARKLRLDARLSHKEKEKWRSERFGVQFEDTPVKGSKQSLVASPSTSEKKKWVNKTPVNTVPTPTVISVKEQRKAPLKKKKKLNL